MGTVDLGLASHLRDVLGLQRAVETGTFRGVTARRLASIFPSVVTIELSEELHRTAETVLSDLPGVRALQGHSTTRLHDVHDPAVPTLFYLDGHWSGGITEGADDQCPVLAEIAAIGTGSPDDCIIVDDARLFTSAPPPPHNVEQWPTLLAIFDAIRRSHPEHLVTLLNDQVIAAPERARPAIDAYGARIRPKVPLMDQLRSAKNRLVWEVSSRLRPVRPG